MRDKKAITKNTANDLTQILRVHYKNTNMNKQDNMPPTKTITLILIFPKKTA